MVTDKKTASTKINESLKALVFPIKRLTFDKKNVLVHEKRDIAAIKASLKRYGQQKNICALKDGTVIAGNGTLQAAIELGWTEIAVAFFENKSQAAAFALADNKSGRIATWDEKNLADLVKKLLDDGEDLGADFGFTSKELDHLMGNDSKEKEVPLIPVPKNPRTKNGQLFILGNHRLCCGDATKEKTVAQLLGEEKPDLVVTDPPYGIGFKYANHDDGSNAENAKLVKAVFDLLPFPKVWTPGLQNLERDLTRFGAVKVLVWNKKYSASGNGLGGASTWEPIFVISPQVKRLPNDVIEIMTDRASLGGTQLVDLHPCPKPVALFSELIKYFTNRGQIVVDPFGGSGTTLIAGEKLGRRVFCIEKDPAYCDVIVDRWEKETGKKAKLVGAK